MKDLLRNIGDYILNPKEKERAAKQAAIAAWEGDTDANSSGWKAVRGQDGLPVEVIMKGESSAFVVNGQERLFEIGDLSTAVRDLCLDGILQEGYIVEVVKRLDFGNKNKPLDILAGTPTGTPPGLVVPGNYPII